MLNCIINESVGVRLYGAQLGVNKNEKVSQKVIENSLNAIELRISIPEKL